MKKTGFLVAVMLGAGLLFTSCEKEYLSTLPGNTQQNVHKDGDAGADDGIIDEDDDDDIDGITDGGRDEDYDKTGKNKKPKPN